MNGDGSLTVVIIDNRADDRTTYRQFLQQDSLYCYHIAEVETIEAAINWCQHNIPSLILLSAELPDGDGLFCFEQLQRSSTFLSNSSLKVIMLSERGDVGVAVQAIKCGIEDYLLKETLTPETLQQAVHAAIAKRHLAVWSSFTQDPSSSMTALSYPSPRSLNLLTLIGLQQAILEGTDYAIISVTPEGMIQTFNTAAQRMLGYTAEEVVGQATPLLFHIAEELEQRVEALSLKLGRTIAPGEEFARISSEQPDSEQEWTFKRKDGSVFPVALSVRPLIDASGRRIGSVGIAKDITQRKQLEAKLQRNSLHLATAQRIGNLGSWEFDVQTQEIFWSDEVFRLFGRNPDLAPPTYDELNHLIHPDDLDRHGCLVQQAIEHGQSYEIEFRVRLPDETWRYLLGRGEAILDRNGTPTRLLGTVLDISDRKQAENTLATYAHEVEDLYNNAPCGYHSLDVNGCYIRVNETEMQWFGYTREEMIGKPFVDFLTEASRATFWQNYPQFKQRKWVKDLEFDVVCKDGSIFPVLLSATAVSNADGSYSHSRSTLFDVRDRKQVEKKLQETNEQLACANAELARATKLKDEFLANMSHELRTPLTAIIGMSDVLRKSIFGELTAKQHQYIEIIAESGKHLLSLINDILDLAKIESGKLELQLTPASVQALCSSSLSFVKHMAHKKQIALRTIIASDVQEVLVDELRIRQALINLLSNAVKFTPDGGSVELHVTRQLVDASQAPPQPIASQQLPPQQWDSWIVFSVVDTGIGIASTDFSKLFQPFTQIDGNLNRQYSGTGLGLSLVRQIAELHGGEVTVSSEVDRGSRFTLRLPDRRDEPELNGESGAENGSDAEENHRSKDMSEFDPTC